MADPARRSIEKATFVSIQPSPEDVKSGAVEKRQRGLEKIAFVSSLRASPAEIIAARREHANDPEVVAGLDAIRAALAGGSKSRAAWREIARTPARTIAAAGRALASHRTGTREELRESAQALIASHLEHVRQEAESSAHPDGEVPPPPPVELAPEHGDAADDVVGPLTDPPGPNPWQPKPTSDPRLAASALRSSLATALDWARVSSPERADELSTLALRVVGVDAAAHPSHSVADWDTVADTVVSTGQDSEDWTDDLVDGFEERMNAEPVGRVHLERLDMTPAGILRGELLHSVGLAPKETVTLIHREWSSRETSFEKVVTEELEQSTEEGVTENTELATATDTQSRHASELSVEATASGSYGFASASATVGYNSTSEDEVAKQDSRNHSVSVTRKASSRTRQEHKSTFTVKEQAGVEDQSVRVLTNASATEPMRVDFHQLIRKWKVDLYRHGVRLTYDLVVPAPGIDLLASIDELRRVDHQLALAFEFGLTPGAITRGNWMELAAKHGASVEAPPPETVQHRQQLLFGNPSEEEADRVRFEGFELEIPAGYRMWRGELLAVFTLDEDGFFDVFDDPPGPVVRKPGTNMNLLSYRSGMQNLAGRSGQVAATMVLYRVRSGWAQITIEGTPTIDTFRAWQYAAWAAMRQAAEEAWQAKRQELRQRRDQLGAEIGAWDPLTLRRMEREEIMKTTLKWIFGPAFDLMPGEMARLYSGDTGGVAAIEPSRISPAEWAQIMGIGEFIKFIQQAIEWENVLYFVYPYFWDHPRNHALKRFLNHPDSLHRAFLRGGAARVVLTVRPGFEESFTRLYETGTLDDDLEADHPYVTIAKEIAAYAATNYPGIPPDNSDPEAVDAAERGVQIGQWFEYTPVSALDISVNTPLNELQ
jgi:hypothetical protein